MFGLIKIKKDAEEKPGVLIFHVEAASSKGGRTFLCNKSSRSSRVVRFVKFFADEEA